MDRSNLYNVIHLSLSFILIFMSYGVAQTFQTSSDYAKTGAFAVGIIYIVFCLSNLAISSYVTRILGAKLTLIISSLTYVLFIAANIKYNIYTLCISAFLLGFGAALLWTAQGVYVTISTNKHETINNLLPSSTRGFMNGIFFGLFSFNLIIGSLIASILFRLNFDQWIIFTIMTAIAGVGSFSLVFLRPVKIPKNTGKLVMAYIIKIIFLLYLYLEEQYSALTSLSILIDIPFILLIPTICYYGLSEGFIYATIPPLIVDKSRKFLLFALFGVVSACSSVIFGKLSDFLRRHLVIVTIGALVHMIAYGLLLIVWKTPLDQNRIEIFVILIILFSIGDAIYTTQIYSILGMLYGETRPADAFACLKLFQSGCSAIGFVEQVYVSVPIQILCLIVVLSLSLIALIYEHYGVISLDKEKITISMEKEKEMKMEIEEEVQKPLTTLPNTV